MFSSVDTLYAFFLVEVTRFLKKQLVGSAFLLALLKLLIAMTAKTLKSFYNYDKKKKILDILITVDLYKCMDFILSTCKVTIYYKTKSIDKVTSMYSLYISLFYLQNSL